LIDDISTPHTVSTVLEALVHEGRIQATEARGSATKILERVDTAGRWRGKRENSMPIVIADIAVGNPVRTE
jgi:hypothetical protein